MIISERTIDITDIYNENGRKTGRKIVSIKEDDAKTKIIKKTEVIDYKFNDVGLKVGEIYTEIEEEFDNIESPTSSVVNNNFYEVFNTYYRCSVRDKGRLKNAFVKACAVCDIFFSNDIYYQLLKRADVNSENITRYYMSKLNLYQYKNKTFLDSELC